MTSLRACLLLLMLAAIARPSVGQVTNLTVNGVATGFAMRSGDEIRWEYDLPVADSASLQIWYDVNANGVIESATDVPYVWFVQVDGQLSGTKGPPDMDGTANGHITFSGMRVGLAPGGYIMSVTCHGVGQEAVGTVAPLSLPMHMLSGRVTPPPGKSARNIIVEASRSEQYSPSFWDAVTDVDGDFTIAMDSDTAGNPWYVEVLRNPYPPSVAQPEYRELNISGVHVGLDFSLAAAAAQVAGTVTSEFLSPLQDFGVHVSNTGMFFYREGRTDAYGFYQIGLLASELGSGPWVVQTSQEGLVTTDFMIGQATLPTMTPGDSIVRNLVVYRTDDTIFGAVRINGSPPGFPVTMIAASFDTAQSVTEADPGSGSFTLRVSSRISSYSVFPVMLPPNYSAEPVVVSPGASGVIVNVTTTGVGEETAEIPEAFSLEQNYPNPFNPATTIGYTIAGTGGKGSGASDVRLSVYDMLGREVAVLVNEQKAPGKYEVEFVAANLSSGVYVYRLTAGSFLQTRKMLLLQ